MLIREKDTRLVALEEEKTALENHIVQVRAAHSELQASYDGELAQRQEVRWHVVVGFLFFFLFSLLSVRRSLACVGYAVISFR
ncbi:MAG: hypothetical protein ACK41O_27530, partial [Runella zeae]